MNLRNPITKRLPLTEIMVGPKASFPAEKIFLEGLLDEIGYGSTHMDRPRITVSLRNLGNIVSEVHLRP